MAVIYNNRVCIYANELISYNPRTKVGSEKGFMAEGTYYSKVRRGHLEVARRSTPCSSALVYFDTMEHLTKKTYVMVYGNPEEELQKSQPGLIERYMGYNEDAYSFFCNYTDDAGNHLKQDKIEKYTLQARVLDTAIMLARDKQAKIGDGTTRFNVWDRISNLCNDLTKINNSRGEPKYPHGLPKTGKTLKRKADQYKAEGYIALINKNHGNQVARKINNPDGEAIMHKLLSQHMNLNNVQIMNLYNTMAETLGMKQIESPVTIEAYRQEMNVTTIAHRKGLSALRNGLEMQVKRDAPETAMTYWTLDGWTVELLYQKKEEKIRKVNGVEKRYMITGYTYRKTMVVVLDAYCKYPVGYAIGDNECPALIREALRNAIKHAKQLFGQRYKPMQMQSDNYQKKVMVPFYEAMTKYYTPAALKNAKSKIVEPYFAYLNKTYCQLQANWSGFNITANKDSQPNLDILNQNHKCLPDEEGVMKQIHAIMQAEREKKFEAYMKAWDNTPMDRRLPFSDEEYLLLMGDTTGRTNRLTGQGLMIEMMGERINYETFNMEIRNHYNEDWVVHYDPDDKQQVLITNCTATKGHKVDKELGTLRFMLQKSMKIPMALVDQKPEHHEYLKKVRHFNAELEQKVVEKQKQVDEQIISLKQRIPSMLNYGILDRALITDSMGQHKDRRTEERQKAIEDADIVEEIKTLEIQSKVIADDDDDDDYEWNATDMSFSR